jgi:CRP/FNR family transcriptional regulator, cyclic AMP receptor protein
MRAKPMRNRSEANRPIEPSGVFAANLLTRTTRRVTRTSKLASTERPEVSGGFRQRNILGSLGDAAKELLLNRCDEQRFKRGEVLYVQGSRHKASYLLVSGLVRSYHTSVRGKELTIGYWSAGDLIGGPHFFDDTKCHIWSARAVEDSSAFAVSGQNLRQLTLGVPEIGNAVLDAICFKLHWDSLLMQVLGTRSVSARLADLLVKLAALHGDPSRDGVVICRRFSQDDLACMVGATRQWINAKMVDFERRGLLAIRDNRLVIRDLPGLEDLVN